MGTKKKQSNSYLIFIAIVLLIVVVLYFFFKTEGLKDRKENLEYELRRLRSQIREKELNIEFLTSELNRMKFMEGCLINYAIRLYRTIKLILLIIALGLIAIVYLLFNYDLFSSFSTMLPILTFGYYGISIAVRNRIGDFNRTLKLIQEHFINAVLKANRFDVSLIETLEAKIELELQELNELRQKYSTFELKAATFRVG